MSGAHGSFAVLGSQPCRTRPRAGCLPQWRTVTRLPCECHAVLSTVLLYYSALVHTCRMHPAADCVQRTERVDCRSKTFASAACVRTRASIVSLCSHTCIDCPTTHELHACIYSLQDRCMQRHEGTEKQMARSGCGCSPAMLSTLSVLFVCRASPSASPAARPIWLPASTSVQPRAPGSKVGGCCIVSFQTADRNALPTRCTLPAGTAKPRGTKAHR